MAQWPNGPMAPWPHGPMAQWPHGRRALGPWGPRALGPYGPWAQWPYGPMALVPSTLCADIQVPGFLYMRLSGVAGVFHASSRPYGRPGFRHCKSGNIVSRTSFRTRGFEDKEARSLGCLFLVFCVRMSPAVGVCRRSVSRTYAPRTNVPAPPLTPYAPRTNVPAPLSSILVHSRPFSSILVHSRPFSVHSRPFSFHSLLVPFSFHSRSLRFSVRSRNCHRFGQPHVPAAAARPFKACNLCLMDVRVLDTASR